MSTSDETGITQHRELGVRIPVVLCEGWPTLPCLPALPHPNLLPCYRREWKEKRELLLQWIQTGFSSVFEVVMGAVSCTRWPKLLPGHIAQGGKGAESLFGFVSFGYYTNSLLEGHQQLIDQTIFKAIWTIDFLSHLGALGSAHHCIVWTFPQDQETLPAPPEQQWFSPKRQGGGWRTSQGIL